MEKQFIIIKKGARGEIPQEMSIITIDQDCLHDFNKALSKEWIVTNGLGGYASSSILCCNTRPYHGLLVAARPRDPERMVLLAKLEESISVNNKTYNFSTNKYSENHIHPDGYFHLRKFELNPFPRFIFTVDDVILEKEIFMIYGKNTTVIRYRIFNAGNKNFTFIIHPLAAFMSFHFPQKENTVFSQGYKFENEVFEIQPYPEKPILKIKTPGMDFRELKYWYKNFTLDREKDRGLDHRGDLFNHGHFFSQATTDLRVDITATIKDLASI